MMKIEPFIFNWLAHLFYQTAPLRDVGRECKMYAMIEMFDKMKINTILCMQIKWSRNVFLLRSSILSLVRTSFEYFVKK